MIVLARGSEQKSLLFASSPGHSDLLGLVSWDGGDEVTELDTLWISSPNVCGSFRPKVANMFCPMIKIPVICLLYQQNH